MHLEMPPDQSPARTERTALALILGLHAGLLVSTLTDYRVSIDSGYHVSLARYYAEHGTVFWDHINYGPAGRPNLQGPALHLAIGLLGRVLGGSGDAYVLANALLAVLQWAAAMWTVVFFARRFGGDRAALFGATLLSGSVASAIPFSIGIPSGWVFIVTPWAIHFFLKEKLWASTLFLTLGIYSHLGGLATAPVGVLLAALLTRRWRSLLVVGAATALLSAPYLVHFLRYRDWYRGEHGHVSLNLSLLVGVASLLGFLWSLRRPRANAFLVAWFLAPVAWIFQDYTRFVAQVPLAGAALGGIALDAWLARVKATTLQRVASVAFVALTTILPFGIPSLASEAGWAFGPRYPRGLDWAEARRLAEIVQRAGRPEPLVSVYFNSFAPALAAFAPLQVEKGHWVEVQPRSDPADDLSVSRALHVVPVPARDDLLADLVARGWIRLIGSTEAASVVALERAAPVDEVARWLAEQAAADAEWLAANAENNTAAPLEVVRQAARLVTWRASRREQRTHAGRLELAMLLYALAHEGHAPEQAKGIRGAARGWGSLAAFLGDESCIGFVSTARHQRFRTNVAAWARALRRLATETGPTSELGLATKKLFGEYFSAA